jgi:hypothetical protein
MFCGSITGGMRSPTNFEVAKLQISDSAIAVVSYYFRWGLKLVKCNINAYCARNVNYIM